MHGGSVNWSLLVLLWNASAFFSLEFTSMRWLATGCKLVTSHLELFACQSSLSSLTFFQQQQLSQESACHA